MSESDGRAPSIDDVLAAARARLDRVQPADLEHERIDGALIVDIRPIEQRTRDGDLPGAIIIDRNVLEWRLDPACAHHLTEARYDTRVIIVCNEGYSSSLAAAQLRDLGLHRATDLDGGYQAWLTFVRVRAERVTPTSQVPEPSDSPRLAT